MQQVDVESLSKAELRGLLRGSLDEAEKLRESVGRLLRVGSTQAPLKHHGHPDDFVPPGWAERHGIGIPRADGVFESSGAWVRVKHGVVVAAGLRNQSILSVAISLGLLDQGAEHHGNLFKDWKAAFLSRLDPGTSGGEGGDKPTAWTKEDRYSKLLHRVDPDNLSAMDCIVAPRPKSRALAAFQNNQDAFVEAFKAVARVMAEINREAEEAEEQIKGR